MIRPMIAALAPLIFTASVFAQADPSAAPAADPVTNQSPPFVSSLLCIKADWSQVPAAKEIEGELRAVLSGESILADRLQSLPASGASILFPAETASIYTREHYASLVAWLKLKGLALDAEPFSIAEYETVRPLADGTTESRSVQEHALEKNLDFLGLTLASRSADQALVASKTVLRWTIQNAPRLAFSRTLRIWEKPRGELRFIDRGLQDQCTFHRQPLKSGEVLIVPAFPSANDRTFRVALAQQGFMALIVVEGNPPGAPPATDARLILPDKVERIDIVKDHSADSSLMIGQSNSPASSRYIISKDVMISWSEAKDVAWGFSKSLGKWAEQKMDPPAANTAPAVSEDLAVWRVGNAYYAFSSQTGRWDVLRLPEGHTPVPQLQDDFVLVHDGDNDYTFANSTGRWSSPKEGTEASDTNPVDPHIKIFTLRNAKANDARHLIEQLFPRDIQSVASDPRSNSVIVRGPPEQLNIILAILTRLDGLDEELGGNQAARADKPQTAWPKGEGGMSGPIVQPMPSADTVAELAKQYDAKEQQAAELARQIRELQVAPEAHKLAIKEMAASLRKAVGEAFAARQALHHAEVGQLQQRIASIQRNVATRDRLNDKIIDVRVNDLLNPELQWESRSRLPGGTLATDARAATTPSTAQPKSTRGAWWGPESEQILQELGLQVQKLTRDDAPEPNLVGALKITAIDPESPVKELQVGCLIMGLQMTGGRVKGGRRVEIHARRGNDRFPVIVELPPRIATSSVPGLPGETSPLSDLSAQRAYRDKQRQRWEQIERLYHGGRMEFDVMMQAAKDLAEAELAAAATPDDRRAARQRSLELLKGVKSIVDAKFDANVEPEHKKLAVDAEVLKAEAQLAAESGHGDTSRPRTSLPPPTPLLAPTRISLPTSEAATLRSADDFRRNLHGLESSVAAMKSPSAPRDGQSDADHDKERKFRLERYQRDLAFLREEYAAQIHLLELEVQDASSAVESAAAQLKQTHQEFESGHATRGDVVAQERAVQAAQLRLQRAKTLLDLYRKADPKNAVSQPGAKGTEPGGKRE